MLANRPILNVSPRREFGLLVLDPLDLILMIALVILSVRLTEVFSGLQEGERPGRPRRISDVQWSDLEQVLRSSPRSNGYGQNLWDGKLLSHHLHVAWDVDVGVRQCQRLFRQMGFRRRKPRPLIAKADPEAQG